MYPRQKYIWNVYLQLLKEKLSYATCELNIITFQIDNLSMCKFSLISRNVLVWRQQSLKNNREVSYFLLLQDTGVPKDLIPGTSSQVYNFPSKMFVCSDHFHKKSFDPSWKLRNDLYYEGCKISSRLFSGFIPTFYPVKG